MNNSNFMTNIRAGRHGRGAQGYRALDPDKGEYAVEYAGRQLLNMRRNYSLISVILSMLVFIADTAAVIYAFKTSVILGAAAIGINGIIMIVVGVKGIKVSSQKPVFESNKIPVTASVCDSYYVEFTDRENTDIEGNPMNVKGYIPVYECQYNGQTYIFERQRPFYAEKKTPVIGRKISIFLDEYEPEKTVFADDLERYIKENKSGSAFVVFLGITAIVVSAVIIFAVAYLMSI